ncbi:hypothetical protein AB1Y20_009850 [Prymnesium parvum]|uniref:Uncharacterized protein n=1 Tax=Prymnesium parvum TaxID=97485 RepID=A0AB34K5K7_PRYPA
MSVRGATTTAWMAIYARRSTERMLKLRRTCLQQELAGPQLQDDISLRVAERAMHGCACGRCGRRTAISPCPLGPAPAFRSADGHEAAANEWGFVGRVQPEVQGDAAQLRLQEQQQEGTSAGCAARGALAP